MSEFAGNLPRKFISFRHLGVASSAHNLSEGRESENPQNVEGVVGASTVEVGETSNSPAKVMSVLQNVPVASEVGNSGEVEKDRELTRAEKDCVMTSSEEEMDNLNAFVDEKLQSMAEKGWEQLVGDESVNVEEILSGNLAAVSSHIIASEGTVGLGVGEGRTASVCPGLTIGGDVDVGGRMFSPDAEINRILREELGSTTVTSTPKRTAWPNYSKKRSSVLKEPDVPVCKAVVFDVAGGSKTVRGVGLSQEGISAPSEGVSESFVTSGGFSTLEGIA